jgi:hypothetical protein
MLNSNCTSNYDCFKFYVTSKFFDKISLSILILKWSMTRMSYIGIAVVCDAHTFSANIGAHVLRSYTIVCASIYNCCFISGQWNGCKYDMRILKFYSNLPFNNVFYSLEMISEFLWKKN